jgi:hypothetical protein
MRRIPLPRLMGFHPEHSFRCWANASSLLIYDWRSAFPAPKRRRLTFPKVKA